MELRRALPDVVDELDRGLRKSGRTDLAATLTGLELVDRCRCGDSFCATSYTQPKASWPPPAELEDVVIEAPHLLSLTIANGRIVAAEFLWRPALRARLLELLP